VLGRIGSTPSTSGIVSSQISNNCGCSQRLSAGMMVESKGIIVRVVGVRKNEVE